MQYARQCTEVAVESVELLPLNYLATPFTWP